jgi:hypothetical protein
LSSPTVKLPNGSQKDVKKQVGYFVRADGPKFDTLLSPDVIANLKLIDGAQPRGLKFINLTGVPHSIDELEAHFNGAVKWLTDSKAMLAKHGLKQSELFPYKFGELSTTMQTIKGGPLGEDEAKVLQAKVALDRSEKERKKKEKMDEKD